MTNFRDIIETLTIYCYEQIICDFPEENAKDLIFFQCFAYEFAQKASTSANNNFQKPREDFIDNEKIRQIIRVRHFLADKDLLNMENTLYKYLIETDLCYLAEKAILLLARRGIINKESNNAI